MVIAFFDEFTGDEIMHTSDDDIFVVTTIKNPDFSFFWNFCMDAPEEIMIELI
jgi:hypothetical protein